MLQGWLTEKLSMILEAGGTGIELQPAVLECAADCPQASIVVILP